MSASASLRQTHFRFRSDTGTVDGTPTWIAGEDCNVNIDVSGGNTKFRLRFAVQETNGVTSSSSTYGVYYSKMGGAAAAVTTSTASLRAADVSSDASSTNVTVSRLSGTGSFQGGEYDEDGTTDSITNTANQWVEIEWGLEIVAADVSDGDTIDISLRRGAGGALNGGYALHARLTISKSAPSFGAHITSMSCHRSTGGDYTSPNKIAVTAGNLIIVGGFQVGGTFAGYSDSAGNTYTNLDTDADHGWAYAIAGTTAEITITLDVSASGTTTILAASVYNGTYDASPLDQNPAWTVGDTTNPRASPSSGTLSQADELVIGLYSHEAGATATNSLTAGSPFTLSAWNHDVMSTLNIGGHIMPAHQIVSATAAQTANYDSSSATTGNIGIATFKKSVGGGGGQPYSKRLGGVKFTHRYGQW
jgi:hypothetical protein